MSREHFAALRSTLARTENIASARIESRGRHLAGVLDGGGRLLACGNGGSAAEAQHLTGELVGRFLHERRPLSAIPLHADTSALTAIGNDYGGHESFARQVFAHGRITGGASGLGAATAQAVLAAGGRPLVLDRNVPSIEVDHVQTDLTDRAAIENAVAALVAAGGNRLQAVFTAAGIDCCGPFGEVPAEEWERVVTVNLLGTARVVRAALPHLERSRGTVVICSSTLGLRVFPDATAYCAAKFGVIGFTRALAAETAGRIGVTLLIPGGMHTAFFEGRDEQCKPPPDAKLNRPQDVAAAVLHALRQPPGCELREMVVCSSEESSWP